MRTKFSFMAFAVVMIFAMIACGSGNGTKDVGHKATPANFLGLSDVHFNPFYDPSLIQDLIATDAANWDTVFEKSSVTSFGHYGTSGAFIDTGYPLFKSALAASKNVNAKPEFITINGDFLAHNFEPTFQTLAGTTVLKDLQDFTVKTMEYIVGSIAETFPGTPIFPTLGNNDAFCGDYEIRTPGSFLNRTAPIFQKVLNGHVDDAAFDKSYKAGGYFVATNPGNANHKIISLNTVVMSPKHNNRQDFCGNVPDSTLTHKQVEEQFTWLEAELKAAQSNNHKVWLMYHIPPGFDSWSTNHHNQSLPDSLCQNTVPSFFYYPAYNTQYMNLVSTYKDVIVAQFGGHTHMDNFMVINGDTNPDSFVHIQPSFSPINGNNPGFLEYTFDNQSGIVQDYEAHGFNNIETVTTPDWKPEYKFSTAYGESPLTPQTLKKVYTNFLTDKTAREKYLEYYVVEDSASAPTMNEWRYYYCAFGNQTVQSYNDCICKMVQ